MYVMSINTKHMPKIVYYDYRRKKKKKNMRNVGRVDDIKMARVLNENKGHWD